MSTPAYSRLAVLVAPLVLAACDHHRVPRGGETITYAALACHGTCPVYTVTLGPDGQGIFEGQAHVAVTGARRFRASPEQVRSFTAALTKLRPDGERLVQPGRRDCGPAATDLPGADVQWQGAGGVAHLRVDFGCRGKKARRLAAALRGLPASLLPLQPFLGSD